MCVYVCEREREVLVIQADMGEEHWGHWCWEMCTGEGVGVGALYE